MREKIEGVINTAIDHFKKSPVLQKTVGLADGILDELNKSFHHEPTSLDALTTKLSADADRLILENQRQSGLSFVGGELVVSSQAKKHNHFSLTLKLYFQDTQQKVILKETYKELGLSVINESSQKELNMKQEITYEVNPPK